METPVVTALIAAGAALVAAFFSWRASTRATDRQTELGWAREVRQDAIDAREEVDQLRQMVRTLQRQLEVVTREADHWIAESQTMRRHINRPGITLDRLRELFPPMEPPTATANGR